MGHALALLFAVALLCRTTHHGKSFGEKKNSVAPRKSCGGPVALDVQASMQLGPGWLAELSAVDAC